MKKFIVNMLLKFRLLAFVQFLAVFYNNSIFSIKNARIKVAWRNMNLHNQTFVTNTINETYFPKDKVKVGKHSYGPLCVHHFGTSGENLVIGNYCSISFGVKFILGGNHSTSTFSTFPFRYYFNNQECEAWSKGSIIIEDDVWIGTDAIILSGVKLGKGTIVAAGSVITKSTLPYSLIAGNPAKLIKMRFDDAIIKVLMDIDFGKIDEKRIKGLLPKMYMPLNETQILEIKNELLK